MRSALSTLHLLAVLVASSSAVGCASPGKFVWADDYSEPKVESHKAYALAPGDLIQVRVFNQEQLATRARIRTDGKVSLPLLNDVTAAGLTPVALAADLQERLKEFIKNPLVTVSLEETRAPTVYVTGEVSRPGVYPIEAAPGVLQALVNAGGLTLTAHEDRIYVLRDASSRIRFTYDALVRLQGKAAVFRLRPGDVVVVE